jgi:hypothetical protein
MTSPDSIKILFLDAPEGDNKNHMMNIDVYELQKWLTIAGTIAPRIGRAAVTI